MASYLIVELLSVVRLQWFPAFSEQGTLTRIDSDSGTWLSSS